MVRTGLCHGHLFYQVLQNYSNYQKVGGPQINHSCFHFQIMRDPDTGNSKGYAFINFASFEAADSAIEAMNGQYLCNRAITISYAFRKDSKGERHGSAAGICHSMCCLLCITVK